MEKIATYSSSEYGKLLSKFYRYRQPEEIKCVKQSILVYLHCQLMRTAILLLLSSLFSTGCLIAQINVIEVDTVSGALKNIAPYDKPFQIKLKLQQNNIGVGYVMIVKKYRYNDMAGSLINHPYHPSQVVYIILYLRLGC